METGPKKSRDLVVRGVLAIVVVVAAVGGFYLVRSYTGFGGYPTIQLQAGSSAVVHLGTSADSQSTWELAPQIVIRNTGEAAAAGVRVVWSRSGGPRSQPSHGVSVVGTIRPGSSRAVSWNFTSGQTSAPFPTYVVTATVQYSQGKDITGTVTLTPPERCAETSPGTACG